jgi:biotin transporter BioY
MPITSLVFAGVIAGFLFIASVMAAFCHLLTNNKTLSLALGTLAIPILLCALLAYWILTMEADDPAPGNVLIGSLIFVAVLTPVAFLASYLTTSFLARRASRNVR